MLRLINRLFAKKATKPAQKPAKAPLSLEAFEGRCVPAGMTFHTHFGLVEIEGTNGADTAVVQYSATDPNRIECWRFTETGEAYYLNLARSEVRDIWFKGFGGSDQFYNYTEIGTSAYGGDGIDYLMGGAGHSFLEGGEGDDVLWCTTLTRGNATYRGYGTFSGGAGNDSLYAGEHSTALYGGEGDDRLYGGNSDDTIYGEGGNDHLYGYDGWDCLYGGEGDDVLYGMGGVDYLYGQGGHDRLYGGDGTDLLWGGWGNDRLHGEGGVDWMWGEDGLDELHGGAETDILSGGRDADRLFGNGGADILNGDEGSDYLDGGLDGYADTLRGGADADVFVLRWSEYDSTDFNYWEYDQWSLHSLWEIQSSVSPSFTSTGAGGNWGG